MAIEMSAQGTINSLLSSTSIDTSNTTIDSSTQEASGNPFLPSFFAALMATSTGDEEAEQNSNANQTSAQLLDTSLLDSVVSDDAIAVMQNQLLGALQNNVFAALTASAATTSSTTYSDTSNLETSVTTMATDASDSVSMMGSILTSAFGEDGLSIQDGFDAVNILNHLPVISDIYEHTTSNHTAAASSLAGSFIYGGMGGLLYNAVDLTIEGVTGKSISSNLWDLGKQIINSDATSDDSTTSSAIETGITPANTTNTLYEFARRNISE